MLAMLPLKRDNHTTILLIPTSDMHCVMKKIVLLLKFKNNLTKFKKHFENYIIIYKEGKNYSNQTGSILKSNFGGAHFIFNVLWSETFQNQKQNQNISVRRKTRFQISVDPDCNLFFT